MWMACSGKSLFWLPSLICVSYIHFVYISSYSYKLKIWQDRSQLAVLNHLPNSAIACLCMPKSPRVCKIMEIMAYYPSVFIVSKFYCKDREIYRSTIINSIVIVSWDIRREIYKKTGCFQNNIKNSFVADLCTSPTIHVWGPNASQTAAQATIELARFRICFWLRFIKRNFVS